MAFVRSFCCRVDRTYEKRRAIHETILQRVIELRDLQVCWNSDELRCKSYYWEATTAKILRNTPGLLAYCIEGIRYTGFPYIDVAAAHFTGSKQGNILWLPGVKYLRWCTKLATRFGDFPLLNNLLESSSLEYPIWQTGIQISMYIDRYANCLRRTARRLCN